MAQWWSWVLPALGVLTIYLAGRKYWWAWLIGIGAEGLWVAYATVSHQWGFYVSAMAYGGVYLRNLLRWRHEAKQREEISDDH